MPLLSRLQAHQLLEKYIHNEALRHHCQMVAWAMEAYAQKLEQDSELWYQTGLLHDLDWEQYPDQHPLMAVNQLLSDYPAQLKQAVLAHASCRTGVQPASLLDKYLFACDELSGFLHAYSLMRPTGFQGMSSAKAKKKLADRSFAANVNRDDITQGFSYLSDSDLTHIQFLIEVFSRN